MKKELCPAAILDTSESQRMTPARLAQAIIAACKGNAHEAVLALIRINSALMIELEALSGMRTMPRDERSH